MNNNSIPMGHQNINKIEVYNSKKVTPTEETPPKDTSKNKELDVQGLYVEDKLDLSTTAPILTATYKYDLAKVNQLKADFATHTDSFKDMIKTMMINQGLDPDDILSRLEQGETVDVLVDEQTRLKAQEAVSEEGYYGVKATSQRILDFAKAISGGDSSKIELLKSAFKDAFEDVKEYFNNELPDISQKTYDAVMKGFDDWQNNDSKVDESGVDHEETKSTEIK